MNSFYRYSTDEPDAERAVHSLLEHVGPAPFSVLLLFVDPDYDLDGLAAALREHVRGPIMACTTAGGLTDRGYVAGGFVAAAIRTEAVHVQTVAFDRLARFDASEAERVVHASGLNGAGRTQTAGRFGVLLIDGLSRSEERVAALLFGASDGLPLVGGSAGDNGRFERTLVFDGHTFRDDTAVFGLFDSKLPHRLFRFQHFEEHETRAVVTTADSAQRRVSSIDGEPAVDAYRRLIGRQELDVEVVAQHPLLLKVGENDFYARSIQAWDDEVLTMYCALETGMVVRSGQPRDLVGALEEQLRSLREGETAPGLVISFDCIQRRLDITRGHEEARFAEVVANCPVIGFSTYGEQFNGLHVNHTMTRFCFGG